MGIVGGRKGYLAAMIGRHRKGLAAGIIGWCTKGPLKAGMAGMAGRHGKSLTAGMIGWRKIGFLVVGKIRHRNGSHTDGIIGRRRKGLAVGIIGWCTKGPLMAGMVGKHGKGLTAGVMGWSKNGFLVVGMTGHKNAFLTAGGIGRHKRIFLNSRFLGSDSPPRPLEFGTCSLGSPSDSMFHQLRHGILHWQIFLAQGVFELAHIAVIGTSDSDRCLVRKTKTGRGFVHDL